jgi:hypothetical protein
LECRHVARDDVGRERDARAIREDSVTTNRAAQLENRLSKRGTRAGVRQFGPKQREQRVTPHRMAFRASDGKICQQRQRLWRNEQHVLAPLASARDLNGTE